MMVEQSLLDLLAIQMGCMYLSDLRFLSPEQRRYLAQKLDRLTPREADIWDWNDALDYLTGAPPESTAQAAKAQLVQSLDGMQIYHYSEKSDCNVNSARQDQQNIKDEVYGK